MKEIVVLSGKGGTGKTSITAALASVATDAVFCDNDVDAADLHLLLQPDVKVKQVFLSAWQAEINQDICTGCAICMDYCRFDAIHRDDVGRIEVNTFQCEGCKLCEKVCPEGAISSIQSDKNHWFISDTRFGTLVHARMGPGEENSGKLVTEVRRQAKAQAEAQGCSYLLNDGPPGIGCTVISSLTGANAVLLVIEPTKSGWHDASRLIELIKTFGMATYALINKYDINKEMADEVETHLASHGIPLLAKLAFDKAMVEAMSVGKTIVEYAPEGEISKQIKHVWDALQ